MIGEGTAVLEPLILGGRWGPIAFFLELRKQILHVLLGPFSVLFGPIRLQRLPSPLDLPGDGLSGLSHQFRGQASRKRVGRLVGKLPRRAHLLLLSLHGGIVFGLSLGVKVLQFAGDRLGPGKDIFGHRQARGHAGAGLARSDGGKLGFIPYRRRLLSSLVGGEVGRDGGSKEISGSRLGRRSPKEIRGRGLGRWSEQIRSTRFIGHRSPRFSMAGLSW